MHMYKCITPFLLAKNRYLMFLCLPSTHVYAAISYECIRTITSIYPNNSLIEKAGKAIARFVHSSSSNNWKYLGINALGLLVQINPKYAADHQMIVIDCLDDPDDTLKRKVSSREHLHVHVGDCASVLCIFLVCIVRQ